MKRSLFVLGMTVALFLQSTVSLASSNPSLLFANSPGQSERVFAEDIIFSKDALYVLSDHVWRYNVGDAKPQKLEGDVWDSLPRTVRFVHGTETLTVIEQATGRLGEIENEQITWHDALPERVETIGEVPDRDFFDATLANDVLYVRVNKTPGIWDALELWRFDLQKEKGYLADLNASAFLIDEVRRMYPWAQEALMQDGKLFAFPIDVYLFCWKADLEALEEVGLECPATMDAFFSMLDQWESGLSEQYPEYQLWSWITYPLTR